MAKIVAPSPALERLDEDSDELPEGYGYREWLDRYFPHVVSAPMAPRHERLWAWFDSLRLGVKPEPCLEPWPRGGGKSTTIELGATWVGVQGTRKFVLIVSETQDKADQRVQAIASHLETIGLGRRCGKYGHSKGWRREQLRADNGFNVAGYGLDVASRGVKLDEFRPDLIILDDVDNEDDSTRTIDKKKRRIKKSLLPAGSSDVGVLFVQNLVHEDSVMSQLLDGRADFLLNRKAADIEVAVRGLEIDLVEGPDGANVYKIVAGEATWEGQSIEVCEAQINEWGPDAFLEEAQHEVGGAAGYFFDSTKLEVVDAPPQGVRLRICVAGDLAATEGGGDWTVLVLMGIAPNGVIYVLDVVYGQWSEEKVTTEIKAMFRRCKKEHPGFIFRLPQDPGQAGKYQAAQMKRELGNYARLKIVPVSGRKAVRAKGWARKVNAGNAKLVRGAWNHPFREQHRKFREDESHNHDDFVDAASDAANELLAARTGRTAIGGGPALPGTH